MEKTVDITIVLDRSGSMQSIKKETIDGFNGFISSQLKNEINASITLVQFDHEYEVLYEDVKLKNVNELSDEMYVPRGMTALLDAIGKTIKLSSDRYENTKKGTRPDKMLIVIITDGQENNSTKYSRKKIFRKIKKMEEKYKWEFIFLGANQDAISEASNYGIVAKRAMTFAADRVGTSELFKTMSNNVRYSLVNDKEFEFSDEDRKKQERKTKGE